MVMASCIRVSTIMVIMMPLSVVGALLPLLYTGSGNLGSPPPFHPEPPSSPAVNSTSHAYFPFSSPIVPFYQPYGGTSQSYALIPASHLGAGVTMIMMPNGRLTDVSSSLSGSSGETSIQVVILATVLVAAGVAAGVPCR